MKLVRIAIWLGIGLISACLCLRCAQVAFAQGEGFITSLAPDASVIQGLLPPGAIYQGTQVLHSVSPQENLHLLAGYYYGNPRGWTKIYRINRSVIKNPNRLEPGQTLQIPVEETWKPLFSYQEWLKLAIRNGEWIPKGLQKTPKKEVPTPGVSAPPVTQPEKPATPSQEQPPAEATPAEEKPPTF